MKFLADQDAGHDVVTASDLGMAQADDADLLRVAHEQERIFVTRDRDYGGLVFVQGSGPGVIYLRILPSTVSAVHAELERVLTLYSGQELQISFVVVEPGRLNHREAESASVLAKTEDQDGNGSRDGPRGMGQSSARTATLMKSKATMRGQRALRMTGSSIDRRRIHCARKRGGGQAHSMDGRLRRR
jgi:predicted nuclease of predicted toxin-antitoxin system